MKKTMYLCIALTIILAFGAMSQTANALYPTTDPWLMYRHDVARSGRGTSTAPNNNATVWASNAGYINSATSPAVVNGMVIYSGSLNLYALDEATGFTLWKSTPNFDNYVETPAISDGIAYVGSNSGTIYAINITDGSKIWSASIAPGQIQSSPAVAGRTLYFTTTSNYTYAYDINGTYLWRYGGINTGPIYSSPAIQGNLLYFGCDNGQVYALDVSGSLPIKKWQFNTHTTNIRTTPCIANGKLYVGSPGDSSLYVLNATTGSFIWKWKTTVSGGYGISSPAYYGMSPHNLIFVTGGYNNVYALYADATPGYNYTENDPGAKYWSATVGTYGVNAPVAADGKVFVVQSNTLYALSITGTGAITWFYKTTYALTEPVVADGRIFCGNYYSLFCFGSSFPPLTYYYTVNVQGTDFIVQLVIANATPSRQIGTGLYSVLHQINYTVQGLDGTNGWSNITVPNAMLGGPYTVMVDGGGVVQTVVNNGTHSAIYFTYGQSTHQIIIQGTTIIPEFPSYMALPLLMTFSLIAAAFAKKKLLKN